MAIQWFPGHMHSTRLALAKRLKAGIDVVIEMLDARLPGASANPLLAELTAGKPALKLLNKQDLADPERTALWLAHYNAQTGTQAIGLDASQPAPAARLILACRALAPLRGGMVKPLRLLICGIPNVGKSTLINSLVGPPGREGGRRSGRHQDRAGGGTGQRRDPVRHPRHAVAANRRRTQRLPSGGQRRGGPQCLRRAGSRAGAAGAAAGRIRRRHRRALQVTAAPPLDSLAADELLTLIARQRGFVQSRGVLNLQKAAEVVLTDFRSGVLGRITLETPQQHLQWVAEAAERDARRAEARRLRKAPAGAGRGDEGADV